MITEKNIPQSTVGRLSRGMDCLINAMGIVDAEYFIATVQREYFDKIDLHTFVENAVSYAKDVGK